MRDYTFKYFRQRKHSEPRTGPDNDSRSRREDFDDEIESTKNGWGGNSLVVQSLGLGAFTSEAWV